MTVRRRVVAGGVGPLLVATAGLVAVPFALAAPSVSVPTTVRAKETEFRIALDHSSVKAGKVTFVVDDKGEGAARARHPQDRGRRGQADKGGQ